MRSRSHWSSDLDRLWVRSQKPQWKKAVFPNMTMTTLSGYHLGKTLYEGTRTLVYRGTRTTDSQPVVIKFLRNEYPTFSELVQFRNQYTIAKNLDLPGIVKPLVLETHGNGYALVMPSEGYISLGKWQKEEFPMVDFLTIAIQLVEILHGLYRNRVIHKDIKPANILIHPQTKQVKIIDFSISSLLPKETLQIQNPNVLEGTLAYISPEQTGRMNRGIDYRTDFYSLGVTFYELLTGELPFQSDDPIELVHCHIAKMPMGMGNGEWGRGNGEEIPSVISDIVLKLMAKNAEDRYQSALGLKYDLEKCLCQWKETGKIEPFELAERDICDRFIIPEKLYGREGEVQALLAAFERVANGATEMMLVAGFSGIGKTAVVNEVHKPIVRQRGYFIKGKFDQFNRNIPFSAFVDAFRDLMEQLLGESHTQLEQWKSKILNALGENGQVLIEVIPELEGIVGKQPPVPELSGGAAQNRFNLLFGKFVRVFTTKEHPLVLFLDDLQWADSASLNLLKLLMGDTETGYLLVLGAYRDNEVFPAHPLMLALGDIEKNEATITTITLEPLSQLGLNHLIADTLSCSLELALPLTELVYQKTKGNPFFATQFLKALNEGKWISYNPEWGYWQCDMISVRQLALTEDVVEFMATQLQKLPPETQDVLKLAACIGNQFDLGTLAIVSEQAPTETATALWKALQEGLVLPTNEVYKFYQSGEHNTVSPSFESQSPSYKFLHDRVQQAAYSLIREEQRQSTHLTIGQLLQRNISIAHQEDRIFEIVNQMNIGKQLIIDREQRNDLARLNLMAAKKAITATAYDAASLYSETGIEIIESYGWETQYELTLNLYVAATEASYLNTKFDKINNFADRVLKNAKTLLEKIKIYEIEILYHSAQKNLKASAELGLKTLALLGIEFPNDLSKINIPKELEQLSKKIKEADIDRLLDLPEMDDLVKLAAMKILSTVAPSIYKVFPPLYPLIVFKQIDLSIEYGNANLSAFAYAAYGLILCGVQQDIETGYKFSQIANQMLVKLNSTELEAKICAITGAYVKPWKEDLKIALPRFASGYQSGLESGDLEFGCYCAFFYGLHSYYVGKELTEIEALFHKYSQAIHHLRQGNTVSWNEIHRQTILNLLGRSEDPCELKGQAYEEDVLLPTVHQSDDRLLLHLLYINKLYLNYLFGRYDVSLENANKAAQYLDGVTGMVTVAVFYFYDSLVRLSSQLDLPKIERELLLNQVICNQEKMAVWASHASENFQHKYYLVEAEYYRTQGKKIEAIEMYDRAIAGAKANEYIQEEALANELAAKFYLDWGKEKIAQTYMVEAYYCYARWGAKAKTDHLEANYPQLLAPILQQPKSSLTLNVTQTLTSHQTVCTSTSSNADTSLLDISAAIKAAQALSGEIELEALLSQLMQIVLENAGADKGAFVLNNAETWELVAQCHKETCQLSPIPLDDVDTLPTSMIRAVGRTQKTVILNQVKNDTHFASDTYLIQQQPKSLFCTPILNQGKLIGILYLENHLSAEAFTQERVEVLNLLCSQAAISIENARLYENAQAANKMLQKSLEDLKQAQLQMVQSEKMSALGNLVAGVAHEINNPVGFIGGNLQPARDYVEDLLGLIDLYQEENPNPSETIEEELEAIDLDFLREDLPKLIDSMKLGVDRIAHISTSLRTFSRTDKEYQVPFNLHEGIDSTILILKHRLKANEQRPAIEIFKDYGNIPAIKCFPGQLNQVFMNLIANAIDALDEGNADRSFEEISVNPNQITIRTSATSKEVVIRISDNGVGMPEEVRGRIFEQGFTTKGVGKGTGLGMAIARQIVEEKHGGTIACSSEPGTGTEFAIVLQVR